MNEPKKIKQNPFNFYWDGLREFCEDEEHIIWCFKMIKEQCDSCIFKGISLKDYTAVKKIFFKMWHLLINYTTCSQEQEIGHSFVEEQVMSIIDVYENGAKKHGEKNYLEHEPVIFLEAFGRHLIKHCFKQIRDSESGYTHIAHMFANLLIMRDILEINRPYSEENE